MQACLYPGNADLSKIREFFPDLGPGEMPVAGKSLCRHLVDLCGTLKVSEVFLLDRFLNPRLADDLGSGAYWSLQLHYLNSERISSLRQLLQTRKKFSEKDEDALLIWGLFLPDIRNTEELFRPLDETDPDREDPEPGVYLYRNGKYYRSGVPILECDTLKRYFDINFHLLRNPGVYSLPGYSSQHGYGVGRNVAIMPRADVQTPVLIQDNVLISRGVSIKDGAIIGQFTVIDENTKVSRSIIMNNTYIGRSMVIREKIVNGRRVLDPASDSYVDLDDAFLADDFKTQSNGRLFFSFAEKLFALFLAIFELPVYLPVVLLWKFLKNMPYPAFLRTVYPKIWRAVAGQLQLVRFGSGSDYVFRYSDLRWPAEASASEKNMDDVYYYHHRNFFRMAAVPLGSQLRRMLTLQKPDDTLREGKEGMDA